MTVDKPLQGVRAIFFDLYGTLARFWPPREEIQTQACRDFDLQVIPEGITRGYALADAFMARENAGRKPVRQRSPEASAAFFAEYQRLILQGAGVEADLRLAAQVWARVREIPYDLALFDDVLAALERLGSLELTLGLVSNINRDSAELTESLGLADHIDFVVTSREVGAEKPHPPIFLAALERAAVAPSEAAHVGDQYESDVVGAQAVGIRPVLIDRYNNLDPVDEVPVVRNMAELVELIESWGG